MAKSIMEPAGSRTCYICGAAGYVEEHHVFHGTANRKKSETWGLKVHLCYIHHRDPKNGAHGNQEVDQKLKEEGQQIFEKLYGHEKFMREFGKNYIDKTETKPEPEAERGQQMEGFSFLEVDWQ